MPRSVARSPSRVLPVLLVAALLAAPAGRADTQCPAPPAAASAASATAAAPAPAAGTPAAPAATEASRIVVSSAGVEATNGGKATLAGPVKVEQGERTLEARTATYDSQTESFDVKGNVEYSDPRLKVSGDAATWRNNGGGSFSNADFELPARLARGHADSIVLAQSGKLELDHVSYTACPKGETDWLLRATRIDIDQQAQVGVGHDVRLDFMGVPLFYLPVVSFPVSDARKSGFLFPDFGTSLRNALEFPFYWNLAPNYDATLSPGYIASRGASLGAELRFLTDNSRGELQEDWVPHDAEAGRERDLVRFTERTDFTERLRFDTNVAYASDSNYFEDFGQGTEGTSVLYLSRMARVTYLDNHWRAIGLIEQFETIDTSIVAADRPYTRAPAVSFDGHFGDGIGPGFEVSGEAVNFTRDVGVQGSRYDLAPTASYSFRGPGAYLTPALGWRGTVYSLRDNPGAESSPSVEAPIATVDSGLNFERTIGSTLQTLEPRLLYTYVPYRDQSNLPVFDTTLPDLNLIELFRSDRFVGGDRIGDANQLAVGTTTRFVDLASGRQLLSATLGDIYYFTPPRVQLPNQPVADGRTSDLVTQLDLSAYQHWNLAVGEEWDPHVQRSDLSELSIQYQPAHDEVANFGYRYRRGLLDQVEGSFAVPVTGSWNLYARHVYSLRDKQAIDSLAGFEYHACCWRLRIVGRRYVSSFTGARDSGISVQLELNGLSSVGGQAGAFLERAIRGYSATGSDTGPE